MREQKFFDILYITSCMHEVFNSFNITKYLPMISDQVAEAHEKMREQLKDLQNKVSRNPKDYTSKFKMAVRYNLLGQFRKAGDLCMELVKVGAEQYEVYDIGARSYLEADCNKEAAFIAEKGLEKFELKYELLIELATALNRLKKFKEAEDVYKKASEQRPDVPASFVALGNFYANSGQIEEGLKILNEGLEKYPDSVIILNNLGAVHSKLNNYVEASEYYLKALRVEPQNPVCLINLGSTFEKMKKTEVAQKFFEEALKLEPENPIGLCSKANLLCNNGLAQEAMPEYKAGLNIMKEKIAMRDSQYLTHYSNYVFYMHYCPNVSREDIYEEIQTWQREICINSIEKPAETFSNDCNKDRKLRIGMISGSFSVHPVGQMIYKALENLDKDSYSLYCYSDTPPERQDYLYKKITEQCDEVIDIFGDINFNVLDKIRNDKIDVLLEMTGHSEGGRRLQLVAERAAPVQVKWVGGLFNTTGIPQMDWLLTDNTETPEGEDKWYTEKLYRMPDDYIVYYPPYYAPKVSESPAKKNGFITFGNLNNLAKTNSYSIELWSKILHMVPNSKLLLKGNKMDTPFVVEHLRKSFEAHGIGIDRLLIEGGESHQKFLNVYNRIDIALDPHPYTGGLTTCEALWMGVPVVTLPGETFAGRHAASHLTNAGMPEWIAKDEQHYIDIAVKWATDLEALGELRAELRDHVAKTPLVDGPRFAKNFEIALRHMWGEWCDRKLAADKPAKVTKPKPKKSKKRK